MVASAARLRSASRSTITGSFPPHSSTTGVIDSAHVAATRLAVAVEPVNASLFTPLSHKYLPASPNPVTQVKTSLSPVASKNESARNLPTAGVYSLGLKTTVFPAASA